MDKPLHTVAFTQAFVDQAKDEGMTAAEIEGLVKTLATNPQAGDMIQGSGGCRKVRVAGRGKGKSGGYRVVSFFAHQDMPVYALAVLSKGRRENFDADEIAALGKVAKAILAMNRRRAAG